MTDRDPTLIFDGSPPWSRDWGLRVLEAKGVDCARAERALAEIEAGLRPVPIEWLADRLTLLWGVFMATRNAAADDDAVTAWLGEYVRLLADLPHDVVALAIDRAVQSARHGFIPSIGEIRTLAEPVVAERTRQAERLALLVQKPSAEAAA